MIGRLLLSFCLAISLSYSAVAQSVESGNDRPPLDLSSPESSLKSYWAIKEWYRATRLREIKQKCEEHSSSKAERDSMIPVTTGEMRHYFESFTPMSPEVLDRAIQGIYMENPSRAVITVRIRNVTPIPDGAAPSSRDLEERKNGQEFRYVLLKESDGWKISEVWKAPTAIWPASRLYVPSPPLYPASVYFD